MRRDESLPPALRYIAEVFAPEDEALRAIDRSIHAHDQPIHIGAAEGKLLELLVRLSGARKIVEIGTLGGYSAVWMARAMPEDGLLITVEKDAARCKRTQEMLEKYGLSRRIRVEEGDALSVLPKLSSEGAFDMVFMDADKSQYLDYLDWAERNIRRGGLIVADNTFLFGAVYAKELPDHVRESTRQTMLEFNRRLANPAHYCGILIPTPEGMTVAMRL